MNKNEMSNETPTPMYQRWANDRFGETVFESTLELEARFKRLEQEFEKGLIEATGQSDQL